MKLITYTLTKHDTEVWCLLVFSTSTLLYAAKILATIEWGTQHWKMKEPNPVLPVPKWLWTIETMQTMTPLRGELPLPSPSMHMMDIHVWSPAIWSWMAMLLQYWQDHFSAALYGRRVRKASQLADILMRDINPWMSTCVRFGWDYVANNASTWLDVHEQFVEEHFQE